MWKTKGNSGRKVENPRMIVLSLDAVGSRDLEYMETLPHFKEFFKRAALCREVSSVYPSLTYPAHTSIVTGRYPAGHGIVNNLQFQPEREPSDWFWQSRYVNGPTLYGEAEKHGMRVASLLWPVMGKAKIHYNLPEVLPNRPWQNQIGVCMANGTVNYELMLQLKYGSLRDGIKQPQLDHFVWSGLLYTMRKYRPDLTLVHLTDVDTNRHLHGVESEEARAAIRRHDERLGQLETVLRDLHMMEETDLVILGDHYQKDVNMAVYPNYVFRKMGYLSVKDGQIRNWKILARDCDGSCYIYMKDEGVRDEAGRLLERMKKRKNSGIKRILDGKSAVRLGADPACAFMLEAEDGYYFQNGWDVYEKEAGGSDHHADFKLQAATHGYLPDEDGYRTFFMAAGPHFRAGAEAASMSLVDEGPTLAAVLNLRLGKTDGKVKKELIRL